MTKSSFITFHTKKSTVSEDCLWIHDGKRFVCVSYLYFPLTGQLQYAASVLKSSCSPEELSDEQIDDHEYTTMRRWLMRPIQIYIGTYLVYDDMLKHIRREMCHGLGCVGIRHPVQRSDDDESLSSVEMISDTSEDDQELIPRHTVSPRTFTLKTVHCVKYGYTDDERHDVDTPFTQRTIFICFKGLEQTGDVLYGASIHHEGSQSGDTYYEPELDDESHYETAMMRLEKCPVQMSIPKEFRYQLKRASEHREDVMYQIVDKIKGRIGGLLQIKGERL